jgi:hypothetical protein
VLSNIFKKNRAQQTKKQRKPLPNGIRLLMKAVMTTDKKGHPIPVDMGAKTNTKASKLGGGKF